MVFDADLPEDTIHVIVQRPLPVAKRDREEDAGPSSSRKRHRPHTLKDAIEEAGLTEKAVVDDQVYLSRLSRKERVSLLASIGQDIAGDDIFSSLSRTALELHGANIKDMDKISAPRGILLPVVVQAIYVREAYKDLYDIIVDKFENNRPYALGNEVESIIVTGVKKLSPDDLDSAKICNYPCVDLLLAPRDLFQITVSKSHPVKGHRSQSLSAVSFKHVDISSWRTRLIFVVPSHVYADFEKQDYLTSEGKVYRTVPADIQRVRQYVLKIDLESAAGGKSPGLQIPVQQNAGTKDRLLNSYRGRENKILLTHT
ncbi:hypothetical protein F5H01DRAFT_418784 [Linnemannia elongata]|nr:hypothetical protein F5H01DRAFT_418784 [Linnemannia elongata]